MNRYKFQIELITDATLSEKQQNDFLIYLKYKMDNISVLPKKVAKKLDEMFSEKDIEIIIKKFKIEDEI